MYFSGKKIKWALGLHLLIPRGALKLLTEIPVTHGQQLEKAMAPHSSPLAWKIPWTEEPGGLQSMGSLRVRHNWATSLLLLTFTFDFHFWLLCIGEGNGNPLQCSCLENPMDRGAWWAAVHGVAKGQTQLSDFTFAFDFHFWLSLLTFMHWRRKWQPTPVFLPGEPQGLGSLVGCRLRGHTESDTTEATQQQ